EAAADFRVKIQFAGGLRSLEDIALTFERGASRVVLGTIAVQQPEVVKTAIDRWGAERVGVALDARDGKVTTHGWQQSAEITPIEFGQQMYTLGVRHALYTDVSRDGGLGGSNVDGTIALGRETGLQVIASGGVSTVEEIRQLAANEVAGAVIGMALYEKRLSLRDALAAAEGN
ncbi:MAG TPA: HisA/HisF-related TIM barrel protein, partial [Phototrophicaceae bacterium]|nr:HisA/HisF-related TIM barrel protein [Phototrophicaceae bacterium]